MESKQIAKLFHDTINRLAPEHGLVGSDLPWDEHDADARALIVATFEAMTATVDFAQRPVKLTAEEADGLASLASWAAAVREEGRERCAR